MFNQKKAQHLISYILSKFDRRIECIKLIKLVYYIDRESIAQTGFSVSTDRYVSMKHGPVSSNIYSLINDEYRGVNNWSDSIRREGHDVIALNANCEYDSLSEKDLEIVDEMLFKYGKWDKWKLVDETHKPEDDQGFSDWKGNDNGMKEISKKEMMEHLHGFSEADIKEVLEQEQLNALMYG